MNKNICVELRLNGDKIEIVDGDNGRYYADFEDLRTTHVKTLMDREVVSSSKPISFDKQEEIIEKYLKRFAGVVGVPADVLASRKVVDRLCVAYKFGEPFAITAFFNKGNVDRPQFAARRVYRDVDGLCLTYIYGKAPKVNDPNSDAKEEIVAGNGEFEDVIKFLEMTDIELMSHHELVARRLMNEAVVIENA